MATDDPVNPSIVAIYQSGDVILVVGGDPKTSLLVSSAVLSVASKVFRAMYSGHFREGSRLAASSASKPIEVPLIDDDPTSMLYLCRLLHFRSSSLPPPGEIDLATLESLALACDKYDCSAAIGLTACSWLEPLIPLVEAQDVQMIQNKDRNALLHDPRFCMQDAFKCTAYLRQLSHLGLWPINLEDRSIDEVLSALGRFTEVDLGEELGVSTECNNQDVNGLYKPLYCQACNLKTRQSIDRLADEVTKSVKGLCLDCARKGASQKGEGCRTKHD